MYKEKKKGKIARIILTTERKVVSFFSFLRRRVSWQTELIHSNHLSNQVAFSISYLFIKHLHIYKLNNLHKLKKKK